MNVGMKSRRYTLLVATLVASFSAVQASKYQQKTFLRTRAVGSEDLVLKHSLWAPPPHRDENHDRKPCHRLSITPFFSESTNMDDVGAYFGVNGTNIITVGDQQQATRNAGLGSPLFAIDRDVDGYRLVRQDKDLSVRSPQTVDLLKLPVAVPAPNPRYNKNAAPLAGRVTLRPKQIAGGVRFDYVHDLSDWVDRLFVSASLPVLCVERELNPVYDFLNNADLGSNKTWTLEDFFSGNLDNTQETNDFSYVPNDVVLVLNQLTNFQPQVVDPVTGAINKNAPDGTLLKTFNALKPAVVVSNIAGVAAVPLWIHSNVSGQLLAAAGAANPDINGIAAPFKAAALLTTVNGPNNGLNQFFRALTVFDTGVVVDPAFGPGKAPQGQNVARIIESNPNEAVTVNLAGPNFAQSYLTEVFVKKAPAAPLAPQIALGIAPVTAWVDEFNRIVTRITDLGDAGTNGAIDAANVAAPQADNALALGELLDAAKNYIIQPRETLIDTYNNLIVGANSTQNRDQLSPLTKAKMVRKRRKTNLASLDLAVGYHLVAQPDRYVSITAGLILPTHGKTSGDYLFEPVVGNGGYVGLSAGLDGHYQLWSGDRGNVWFNTHWAYQYLLSAKQHRTLGIALNGGPVPFGQYFAAGFLDQTGALFPAANALTGHVRVKPGSQLEGLVSLAFHGDGIMLDLGYDLHWKDRERISLTPETSDKLAQLRLPRFSPDASTVFTTPPTPLPYNTTLPLSADRSVAVAVDSDPACSPAFLTHRVYAGLGYRFSRCGRRFICVSAGASYEFPHANAEFESYQVWGKLGFLF